MSKEELVQKIREYLYERDDILDLNDVDELSEALANRILK